MRVANIDILVLDSVVVSKSLATSRNYKPIWLGHIKDFAVQATFTGTPDGTFKLQASNDKGNPDAASEADQTVRVTHWTDIADASVVVSAAGDFMINFQNSGFEWFRVVWTADSAGTSPLLISLRTKLKGLR